MFFRLQGCTTWVVFARRGFQYRMQHKGGLRNTSSKKKMLNAVQLRLLKSRFLSTLWKMFVPGFQNRVAIAKQHLQTRNLKRASPWARSSIRLYIFTCVEIWKNYFHSAVQIWGHVPSHWGSCEISEQLVNWKLSDRACGSNMGWAVQHGVKTPLGSPTGWNASARFFGYHNTWACSLWFW